MSNYPKLSEKGKQEAAAIMDAAKTQLQRKCDEALGQLYVDVCEYIESDSWTNFRNRFVDAFMRLDESFCGEYNLKTIAKKIAETYPEKLAEYINQDNVKQIEDLKAQLDYTRTWR